MEDLWAFNEEVVARSIYASEIPIISAVGHEIDFTIADLVADHRAPTPSAAAELVVANKTELVSKLDGFNTRLRSSMRNRAQMMRRKMEDTEHRLLLRDGRDKIHLIQQNMDDLLSRAQIALNRFIEQRKDIENLERRCATSINHLLSSNTDNFRTVVGKLNALNPLSILERGYSVCLNHSTREIVRSANEIKAGDKVEVKLNNGELVCEVEQVISEFLF